MSYLKEFSHVHLSIFVQVHLVQNVVQLVLCHTFTDFLNEQKNKRIKSSRTSQYVCKKREYDVTEILLTTGL